VIRGRTVRYAITDSALRYSLRSQPRLFGISFLCDFCNSPEFFRSRRIRAQIFCSVVTHLLQPGGGLFLMRTASLTSTVVKRSILVAGHKTSVSLEDAFWKGLKEIAGGRHLSLSDLIARIDSDREHGNLSSAIRLFVLDFYREQLSRLAGEH
jgi:predicted DNA-binding ribbon-helix-helix protein